MTNNTIGRHLKIIKVINYECENIICRMPDNQLMKSVLYGTVVRKMER